MIRNAWRAGIVALFACVAAACGGDDSPYDRTCYVPGVSYGGPERGIVYLLFFDREGRVLYRAVAQFESLQDGPASSTINTCFDIPFWSVVRVKAWIGVDDTEVSPNCFGPSSSQAACKPRPTDPQGEIVVSLKPREANRILVPLRKP